MIYEVAARLLFADQDEANDFHHDCILALAKTTLINPGQENREPSTVSLFNNHHDQFPTMPCTIVSTQTNLP